MSGQKSEKTDKKTDKADKADKLVSASHIISLTVCQSEFRILSIILSRFTLLFTMGVTMS